MSNRSVEQFKTRFIIKKYSQEYSIDYDKMFSPVFKLTSLQIILSIGTILNLEIYQIDVKIAFLNREIDSEIYIEQPKGYEQQGETRLICKL